MALTIGAIGVVLGNIGTSPLYAVDQIFFGPAHMLGVVLVAVGDASADGVSLSSAGPP